MVGDVDGMPISQIFLVPQTKVDQANKYYKFSFYAKLDDLGTWKQFSGSVVLIDGCECTMLFMLDHPIKESSITASRYGKGGPKRAFKPGQDGWDIELRGEIKYELQIGNANLWTYLADNFLRCMIAELILA